MDKEELLRQAAEMLEITLGQGVWISGNGQCCYCQRLPASGHGAECIVKRMASWMKNYTVQCRVEQQVHG